MFTKNKNTAAAPVGMGNLLSRLLGVGFAAFMMVLMLSATSAMAAAPPADTNITNQAHASYTDGAGVPQVADSNIVTTIVLPVGSFTLLTGQTFDVVPGEVKAILHTLTNTGNGIDNFNIVLAPTTLANPLTAVTIYNGTADTDNNGILSPAEIAAATAMCTVGGATPCTGTNVATGNLNPAVNPAFKFFVVMTVSGGAANGDSGSTDINAAPVSSSTIPYITPTASNTDTLNVRTTVLAIVKSLQTAASGAWNSLAGQTITYRLAYTNTGASAGPMYIEDTIGSGATAGFTYKTPNLAVWNNGTTTVSVTDAADVEVTPGIHYEFTGGKIKVYIENVAATTGAGYVEFTLQVKDVSVVGITTTSNIASFGIPGNCSTGSCTSPTPPSSLTDSLPVAFDVTIENFVLAKEQALANWTGSACAAAGAYSSNPQNQTPGNCVWYKVTATNGGTLAVSNVAIRDDIPAFTTYAGGLTCTKDPAVTGTPTATAPAVGAAHNGALVLPDRDIKCETWTTVPATNKTFMEFAVRINQ